MAKASRPEGAASTPAPQDSYVQLDAVDVRPASEMREGLDDDAVARYREVLDRLPPVLIHRDPTERRDDGGPVMRLADGYQRLGAHKAEGRRQIRAVVVEGGYAAA